jgi:2-aminoethylphosphonate-pyruvate transaminase
MKAEMNSFQGPDGQEDMPYLLTPGPVTTSRDVKFAMLADWNPHDSEFISIVKNLQRNLEMLGGCDEAFSCVLLSGTAVAGIEATLGSLTPSKRKKTLIVSNGPSGQHALQIMQRMSRNHILLDCAETQALRPQDVAKALDADRNITHVWVVHCETASGIINPIAEIAHEVKSRGRFMMVDATASFGGIAINMAELGIDVLLSCPELCLESVPGLSFVLARSELLELAKDESPSYSMDVHAQWKHFETTGQFKATPPTHTLVALHQALRELDAEGGIQGRYQRYIKTADVLTTRIKALGFSTLLPQQDSGPIVQTILAPRDSRYNVVSFMAKLRKAGFVIAAGAIDKRETFRIGNIGKIDDKTMLQLITEIEAVMTEMGVRDFAPAGE